MQIDNERQQIENSKMNPQLFEPLYVKYYEQILKFVYKRIESIDDCREVTSIVFTKALVNINKYKDYGYPFSSWLYRIAINEITQFYRDSNKMRAISINENHIKCLTEEIESQNIEHHSTLKKTFQYLNENELTLIELRYFEMYSFSEIATILEITENNAKVKTYRVIDKLKKIFNKLSNEI